MSKSTVLPPVHGRSAVRGPSARLLRGLSVPPVFVDSLLAAFLTLLGLLSLGATSSHSVPDDPDLVGVLLVLLSGLPVAVRSKAPVAAFAVTLPASLAVFALGHAQTNGGLGALFCLYSVAALTSLRVSAPLGVGAAVAVGVVLLLGPVPDVGLVDVAANLLAVALFWGAGAWSRSRSEYVRGLEERNAALVAARESQARAGLVEARGAVAREMQDVVGHNLMAMTVQVSAARRLVGTDPAAADAALAVVEEVGRSAVQEVRRVLGILADADDPAQTRPLPGIPDIPGLVEAARRDGLDVRLEQSGLDSPVEPGAGLAVYRVVEESLRNVAKHAGPARVLVQVRRRGRSVEVSVSDDGRGVPSWRVREAAAEKGIGMLSLTKRVESYGGALRAGPRRGGGYLVDGVVPVATGQQSTLA